MTGLRWMLVRKVWMQRQLAMEPKKVEAADEDVVCEQLGL